MKNRFYNKGLTLIELLIAIMLFSIISFSVGAIMNSVVTLQTNSTKNFNEINNLMQARAVLKRDFFHIINRPLLVNGRIMPMIKFDQSISHSFFPFGGKLLFAFQINDPSALENSYSSSLKFIEYIYSNDKIIRREYNQAEPNVNIFISDLVIFENLTEVKIEIAQENDWSESFRISQDFTPKAIKLIITKDGEEISFTLNPSSAKFYENQSMQ